MDMEYFVQRIQCSRPDKQDCLVIVGQLMELSNFAHAYGLLDLDRRIHEDPVKFCDPFMKKAMSAIVDISNHALTQKILYTYLLSGNYTGQQFLKNVVIVETALAIQEDIPLDHIFSFIVPSYFGLDFEPFIKQLFREFKISRGLNLDEDVSEDEPV